MSGGQTGTPRLFVAATEQNTGKTTTCLGLYAALRAHYDRIGFIKPVGQRFVDVEGKRIDEDSVLIRETFGTEVPIEDMSPISVEPSFTRRYINHANHEALVRRIQHSFERTAWEKDFVLVEGTGHAGVGSVFDLSNARVARLLSSKALLVVPGGIGRPIDEAVLNAALFEKEGVKVIGVVMNKAQPEKIESITDIARRGFERLGLELLGVIPRETLLSQPTVDQVCTHIRGDFIHGAHLSRNKIETVTIGAMSSSNVLRAASPGTLLIVPGDREELVMAALTYSLEHQETPFSGMVLSDGLHPQDRVLDLMRNSPLPVVASSRDSYTIANRIHSMTVKTLPGDVEKITRIQNLVSQHINITRILEKIS